MKPATMVRIPSIMKTAWPGQLPVACSEYQARLLLTPSPALAVRSITHTYQRQQVSKLRPSAATSHTRDISTYDWTKSGCQKSSHVKERDPPGHLEAPIPGRNDEHCSRIYLVCQHGCVSRFHKAVTYSLLRKCREQPSVPSMSPSYGRSPFPAPPHPKR